MSELSDRYEIGLDCRDCLNRLDQIKMNLIRKLLDLISSITLGMREMFVRGDAFPFQ